MKKTIAILGVMLVISACSFFSKSDKIENDYYSSNIERFMQNVSIKEKNPRYIIYEYKDVRIDEVASLASKYCSEQSDKKAFLRSAITYKNHLRRATFDCLNLQ